MQSYLAYSLHRLTTLTGCDSHRHVCTYCALPFSFRYAVEGTIQTQATFGGFPARVDSVRTIRCGAGLRNSHIHKRTYAPTTHTSAQHTQAHLQAFGKTQLPTCVYAYPWALPDAHTFRSFIGICLRSEKPTLSNRAHISCHHIGTAQYNAIHSP